MKKVKAFKIWIAICFILAIVTGIIAGATDTPVRQLPPVILYFITIWFAGGLIWFGILIAKEYFKK